MKKTYTADDGWVEYDGVSVAEFNYETEIQVVLRRYHTRDNAEIFRAGLEDVIRPWDKDLVAGANVLEFIVVSGEVTFPDSKQTTDNFSCQSGTSTTIQAPFVVKHKFLGVQFGCQTEESAKFLTEFLNK